MRHRRYINSGQLRSEIAIQVNTPSRGTNGELVDSWADSLTLRARKDNKLLREYFASDKVNSEVTDLFVVRYRPGITNKMRVRHGTRYYDIIAQPPDPSDRKRELHILCKEVL